MSDSGLDPLPPAFGSTRDQLHQVAFFAVSPARYRATGRMGLRHHEMGFATPAFEGKVVSVQRGELVIEGGDGSRRHELTTVREAARFVGHEYQEVWYDGFHDPPRPVDPDMALSVDPDSALALGRWFGFAWRVLAELQEHGGPDDSVSEIQLWPEHFDAATELGDGEKGRRASYGASPGDAAHPEPYVYVAAWSEIDRSNPYWNDEAFNGASLGHRRLLGSESPVETALDFLLEGYRVLHAG